ncbi:MAG: GNAT family N-acetyltransferase [Kaiparowitsia implicata GSE-PSE-MK54-09C]|jgi:GNAT superfamily N-acetyltransferase|nr:GNAT family N-acetyltransferase [Kaiparowitsia implicata GSE-PSE-MK54-09C]
MNYSIRDAVGLDRPSLVKLMAQLQNYERSLHPNRSDGNVIASPHLGYLEELVSKHKGRILVAENEGTILGFLICFVEHLDSGDLHIVSSEQRYGLISDLFVEAGDRTHGIGSALIRAAETHFKQLGLNKLRISTLASNTDACCFYEQIDYKPYEIIYEKRI